MAIKNISITLEAYKRLAALKKEKESFSEVIGRITKKNDFENLRKLHGILKGNKGKEFERSIFRLRKLGRKMHKERIKKLTGQRSK